MAYTVTRTDIITAITQKHPKQPYTQIGKSYIFLQVIPKILSNRPVSIETNALLDYGSDTILLGKGNAKRLNEESS